MVYLQFGKRMCCCWVATMGLKCWIKLVLAVKILWCAGVLRCAPAELCRASQKIFYSNKSFVPKKNLEGLANLQGFSTEIFWISIFLKPLWKNCESYHHQATFLFSGGFQNTSLMQGFYQVLDVDTPCQNNKPTPRCLAKINFQSEVQNMHKIRKSGRLQAKT